MPADVTDLHDNVGSGCHQNHCSDISLNNISDSNGR